MKKVNEILAKKYITTSHPEFEVVIKQNGKVIYQDKAVAGVLNFVERIDNVNKSNLEVEGQTQSFCFGHPVIQLFSFDQLKQKIAEVINQDLFKTMNFFDKWRKSGIKDKETEEKTSLN